jgi:hypothetical protein
MIREMFKNYSNYKFLHLYKNIVENLNMDILLKNIGKVSNIPYRSGTPQGCKTSGFLFCMILSLALAELNLENLEDIDIICYSDDILFCCKNYSD